MKRKKYIIRGEYSKALENIVFNTIDEAKEAIKIAIELMFGENFILLQEDDPLLSVFKGYDDCFISKNEVDQLLSNRLEGRIEKISDVYLSSAYYGNNFRYFSIDEVVMASHCHGRRTTQIQKEVWKYKQITESLRGAVKSNFQ